MSGNVKFSADVGISTESLPAGVPAVSDIRNLFDTGLFVRINEVTALATIRGGK